MRRRGLGGEHRRGGHQVHGAMGFTHEHDLQRYTRRLWAWRDEDGSEGLWQRALGREVLAAGTEGLWSSIVGH